MKTLKLGVIGLGGRGRSVARTIMRLKRGVKVTAIADPDEKGARERAKEIESTDAKFYPDADKMLDSEPLDGILIGTRCNLHTPMAVKVLERDLPLFLEKPVSIDFEQFETLKTAWKKSKSKVVVSFPLRLTPLVERAKEIIDAGEIGPVMMVEGFNNVTYGSVYFDNWYRDYSITQGLFLQKATHDIDYINYLAGGRPSRVAAMFTRGKVYGGNKPAGLRCNDCDEYETCPESPFYKFLVLGKKEEPLGKDHPCPFGKDIGTPETGMNEDQSMCLIEYDNGVQASYVQNFFVRRDAGSRGSTVIGPKGTIYFDWYANEFKFVRHHEPSTDIHKIDQMAGHGGGDLQLAYDFIKCMRGDDGFQSRSDLEAGLLSTLACLSCKKSAEEGVFVDVPGL